MTWLLFYIAYSLQITAACQKGPKCGQVVSQASSTEGLTNSGCVCVCAFSECGRRHPTSLLTPSWNTAETQHSNYFYGFFVCPQGTFSQFNCLRGLFPCGILFQNVAVKVSFWKGRKETMEFFFPSNFLKHTNCRSYKNSPNCVCWN